jgi:G6PDH family F420-dependent oxidoreductase
VTCPTVRIHPAVIVQAAATSQLLCDSRFRLGVGTGEKLNEHILGDRWPSAEVRLEMLEEAVEIIRGLWRGDVYSHQGPHFTVENARIYSLPDCPPPVIVSGFGEKSVAGAARFGDGFVSTKPNPD